MRRPTCAVRREGSCLEDGKAGQVILILAFAGAESANVQNLIAWNAWIEVAGSHQRGRIRQSRLIQNAPGDPVLGFGVVGSNARGHYGIVHRQSAIGRTAADGHDLFVPIGVEVAQGKRAPVTHRADPVDRRAAVGLDVEHANEAVAVDKDDLLARRSISTLNASGGDALGLSRTRAQHCRWEQSQKQCSRQHQICPFVSQRMVHTFLDSFVDNLYLVVWKTHRTKRPLALPKQPNGGMLLHVSQAWFILHTRNVHPKNAVPAIVSVF